ncbi:hypothetical protein [Desulfohalobium retbaense]|uniref:Lipoprotein n=1 Tax=Desulfohalobium retbaense (strain ATCC 49708 / DSM 5692 / JCM 16813 / HR100) TaxID=485915 RepID=C8X1E7_DESRD|nr:hypothetical protein [Desulfohalobium retbaense]ACV68244.1 hypothetical protein Dret_0956 [Desulfohalobium retbaense DSM 5692]
MKFKYVFRLIALMSILVFVSACQPKIPDGALQLNKQSLEYRQLQTKTYDTDDEKKVLSSCAGLLQDLGFNIDESETSLGVLCGSKQRDATQAGQVVASILVAALTGAATPIDDTQKMRASVITKKVGEEKERVSVRVTFQRIVWNTRGQITKKECISEPEVYQEFYSKLSKSLFLEGHKI